MSIVGKRLGKLLIVAETEFSLDDPRRRKYRGAYLVRCDCGIEKLMPRTGIANCRSCGCAQYERNRTTANETIKYFPNRVTLDSTRQRIYEDL